MKVVVIDSSGSNKEKVEKQLEGAYQVYSFTDTERMIRFVVSNQVDAVLITLPMTEDKGIEACHSIKVANPNIPILVLTYDNSRAHITPWIDMGADDVLPRPYDTKDLLTRLYVLIRKRQNRCGEVIEIQGLHICIRSARVKLHDEYITMTPKEYRLLLTLCQNLNKVVSREDLMRTIWRDVYVGVANLDTHFSNLRKKLRPWSGNIKTLKNFGYIIRI